MARRKIYSKDLTLSELAKGIWWREQDFGCITKIQVGKEPVGGKNVDVTETFHKRVVVPADSLQLVLDPNGDVGPPDGTELVVRGEAFIKAEGEQAGKATKVAAFRKS